VIGLLSPVIEPGFFSTSSVDVALVIGAVVAVVTGPVGVFTVIRGQSFAGHALADVGTTGGSGAYLLGISPLWGFVGLGVFAAGIMEVIGVRRPRGRDLATGIVLGVGLGLAALFLYWDTTSATTTGATLNVLFGSIFTLSRSMVPVIIAFGVVAVGVVLIIYRPLVLTSLSPEIAAARHIPVRAIGVLYFLALAVAVSLSAVTIGAILSTAMLIGPAAVALRLTSRTGLALLWSCLIGIGSAWLGVLLAYDSFYWGSAQQSWPVSFFVVAIIFVLYVLAQLPRSGRRRRSAHAWAPTGREA
jgi:zinc/manganese transport system permease protein